VKSSQQSPPRATNQDNMLLVFLFVFSFASHIFAFWDFSAIYFMIDLLVLQCDLVCVNVWYSICLSVSFLFPVSFLELFSEP